MTRRLVITVVLSTTVTLTLGAARHLEPVPLGLNVEHLSNGDILTGEICPLREGTYELAADADTPAAILVDGEPVTGPVHLTAGAHQLMIEPKSGGARVNLRWARGTGPLEPVPDWALRQRKIKSVARLTADASMYRAFAVSEWVWVGTLLLAAAAAAWAGASRVRAALARACDWPALRSVLGASLILNLAGIWWGLPGSWVAIEMKPQYILEALSRHFSHGWFDAYPPVHFYVLTAAWSPMLLLSFLDRVTFETTAAYTSLVLASRLVSIAMAAGMVAAACVCGTRAFGRRAGLFAAAIVAVTAPFLYYAKTANVDVPYLFWWALSMVFYLRLLDGGRGGDYLLFAAAATLSVGTKDQAYGLYLLAPLVIVEQLWRANRRAGRPRAFLRALLDRRLVAAAIASGILFAVCNNIVFNAGGFMDHVRFITGPGSAAYRVYEPTLAGHLDLLRLTVRLIEESMGWPLFLAGVAGVLIAAANPVQRRMTVWLLVPVISYYLGFINVILYNYDRFVLPMCFVLAIFGGLAFDRLLAPSHVEGLARPRARRWGAAAIAGAFAYTLLYAGTVDLLMMEDSRYDAERWMGAHVARTDIVGVSGLHEYLPRLDAFHVEEIATVAELEQEHPKYVVLNADYARAVPPDTGWGRMIAGLEHDAIGYRRVGVFRHPAPWPWLPGGHPDLVGPRLEKLVTSTLRNINPTIEIFQRER